MNPLLPPNATAVDHAITQACAPLGDLPVPAVWNPHTCPESALPALAWALSVDEWDDTWPLTVRRAVVAAALPIHARKGTVASVKAALTAAGFINPGLGYTAQIYEGTGAAISYDGSHDYDGIAIHGDPDPTAWATYQVILNRPITLAQAASARRLLAAVAPARCHLVAFRNPTSNWLHNGTVIRNGSVSYGVS